MTDELIGNKKNVAKSRVAEATRIHDLVTFRIRRIIRIETRQTKFFARQNYVGGRNFFYLSSLRINVLL